MDFYTGSVNAAEPCEILYDIKDWEEVETLVSKTGPMTVEHYSRENGDMPSSVKRSSLLLTKAKTQAVAVISDIFL